MSGPATVTRMAGERSNKMSKEDTMRLMVTKRGFSLLVGAFLALALAACGGSGVKNDRDDALAEVAMLKAELATAQTSLGMANDDVTRLTGELGMSTADVTRLTGELMTAQTSLGMANDDVTRLTGELKTANDDVTRLTGELGTSQTSLKTANDEVTRLTGELGTSQTSLKTANDEVTRLTGELGTSQTSLKTANDEVTRLTGELGTSQTSLKTANDEVTRLTGELGTATGEVARLGPLLKTAVAMIGDATDEADDSATASLNGQLNAAKARIAELEAGTAPDLVEPIRTATSDASTAANDAYMAADTAADEAEVADDNRATIQTGEADSIYDAMMARTAANTAMEEAGNAAAAATAAMTAANVNAATAEKNKAEAAQEAAETARTAAETARDDAEADSMVELKIAGTVKSVGTAMVDLSASALTETINDVMKKTGKIDDITVESEEVMGMGDDSETANVDEERPGVAADRQIEIGRIVDSDEDDARVALIKAFIGSSTVAAYEDISGTQTAVKTGVVTFDGNNDGDEQTFRLKSAGVHFLADNLLEAGRIATATEKGIMLYSYTYENSSNVDVKEYVRHSMTGTNVVAGESTTTYTYQRVDVKKGIKLPHGTDYKHIHFGVWASLGKNDDMTGKQEVSELGIAFVQNFTGAGMTEDEEMPNNGDAKYEGNWVANIQEADEDGDGAVSGGMEVKGDATMSADFRKDTVAVELMGLATLEAKIGGSNILRNRFTGSEAAKVIAGDPHGLDSDGKFTGTVKGAFFGSKAEEAGGVFDYESEDQKDGAFRGAFGGRRTD